MAGETRRLSGQPRTANEEINMIRTIRIRLRRRRELAEFNRTLRNAPPSLQGELWAMSGR
jgi:hypothetical protein